MVCIEFFFFLDESARNDKLIELTFPAFHYNSVTKIKNLLVSEEVLCGVVLEISEGQTET